MAAPIPPEAVGGALKAARARFGLTQAAAGRMLGFSADMVSKIERGKTPGGRYAAAVSELAHRGVVTKPPPRRRQRVRAPGGATVNAPQGTPGLRRTGSGGRVRFGVLRGVTGGGDQSTTIDWPRRGPGLKRGVQTMVDDIRAHPSRVGWRVHVTVRDRDGREYRIGDKGGYVSYTLLRLMGPQPIPRSPLRWLRDQLLAEGYDVPLRDIAGVTLSYWGGGAR